MTINTHWRILEGGTGNNYHLAKHYMEKYRDEICLHDDMTKLDIVTVI